MMNTTPYITGEHSATHGARDAEHRMASVLCDTCHAGLDLVFAMNILSLLFMRHILTLLFIFAGTCRGRCDGGLGGREGGTGKLGGWGELNKQMCRGRKENKGKGKRKVERKMLTGC